MAGQGRKPDHKRRQEAARLRAQGLSYNQIGARMGVTHQAVYRLIQAANLWQPPPGIHCRECGKEVMPSCRGIPYWMKAFCLDCLAKHPEAHFGERLRAFRLAAGLNVRELARRARIGRTWVSAYETGHCSPRWDTIVRLIRVLGTGLVTLGLEKPKPNG
jgi:transcriptional regulator with XRE-family HTH domain